MAQLDSASDSDSDGWRFESVWVRHTKTFVCAKVFFMLAKRIQYLLLTRLTLRVTIAITLALLATNPFGCAISRPLLVQRSFLCLPNGFSTYC